MSSFKNKWMYILWVFLLVGCSNKIVTEPVEKNSSNDTSITDTPTQDSEDTNQDNEDVDSGSVDTEIEVEQYAISLQIEDSVFQATLLKNETTDVFVQQLPMTITMEELNGNEKFYYLPSNLPTNTESVGTINNGDIMLYGDNCLVVFYEGFNTSYQYTRIGKIEDVTNLSNVLGTGAVTITFTNDD